ncbi:hypothetical protein J6TS1_34890 [Siminovitchia terrae]|uniref:Uncharacterized protein n=1 Tax=Siminovitchia terrae TaxID=1914933 RepID=A0ABQ4L122_SIMTE|nr:hypothetical protein J6TS1_34890 [Siminovitchia terrae]
MLNPDNHKAIPEEAFLSHHRELPYDLEGLGVGAGQSDFDEIKEK